MTQQPFERRQPLALSLIHEGMTVYDRAGEKIGTVDQVHFGAEGDYGRAPLHHRPPVTAMTR